MRGLVDEWIGAGDEEKQKRILRSPPPNLPQIAARFGALVRSGTPFVQNDEALVGGE
jgi:hypothetical protein